MAAVELKAFVPARDFALSKRFYRDLGFRMASDGGGIAYFHRGDCAFLPQDFYLEAHAGNFMMHLLVEDADQWRAEIERRNLAQHYPGVRVSAPEDRAWGIRDFTLTDPSGVLWRIGHNIPGWPKAGLVSTAPRTA